MTTRLQRWTKADAGLCVPVHGSIVARFADRWTPEPFSACWLWTGSRDSGGYGRLTIGNGEIQAHRLSIKQKGNQ